MVDTRKTTKGIYRDQDSAVKNNCNILTSSLIPGSGDSLDRSKGDRLRKPKVGTNSDPEAELAEKGTTRA